MDFDIDDTVAAELTRTDAVAVCSGSLGGYDDWRLTTISELMSLIDFSVSCPGPVIDAIAFPETCPGGYRSSSAVPKTSGVVGWQVSFHNGATAMRPTGRGA